MKKVKKAESISTFLGADSCIEGTIEFQGTIRLDGKVKGKIAGVEGTLIIGEKAVIDADISVHSAIIMGEVNGTVEASERIDVQTPACIAGDVHAPVIAIETGVIFNGNCSMKRQINPETEVVESSTLELS